MLLLHESFIRELDPGKNMVGSRDVRYRLYHLTVDVEESVLAPVCYFCVPRCMLFNSCILWLGLV